MGLTEVVKRTTPIDARYIPLISLLIGIGLAVYSHLTPIEGIIVGLSASGLYSGVKRTIE